jgi:hypothetical protein
MLRATKIRFAETHVCPAAKKAAKQAPATAWSRSTSSKISRGAWPASSAPYDTPRDPAIAPSACPAAVPPVKSTRATSSCAASAVAASAPPGSTFTTPGGAPLAARISPSRTTEPGASSEGLTTATLPVARQGASFFDAMSRGWLNGVMSPQTPSGTLWTRHRWSGSPMKFGAAPSVVSASDA